MVPTIKNRLGIPPLSICSPALQARKKRLQAQHGLLLTLCGLVWAVAFSAQARPAKSSDTLPTCSWDQPGVQPFTGDLVAAVDRYIDIPLATRKILKARMAQRQYDDIAVIRRDSVQGKALYDAALRDMHFANGRVCKTVSRKAWPAAAVERGLVYCEGEHCLIVPTVCRNLSRITRVQAHAGGGNRAADPMGADAGLSTSPRLSGEAMAAAAAPAPDNDELQFDPPGAGRGYAQAGDIPAAPSGIGSFGGSGDAASGITAGAGDAAGTPFNTLLTDASGTASFAAASIASDTPSIAAPSGSSGSGLGPGWPVDGSVWQPGSAGGGGGIGGPVVVNLPAAPVPEPGTWLLLLSGTAVVWTMARRRQRGGGALD